MAGRDALRWVDLGRRDYAETLALQESLRARIVEGDESAETVIFVEHAPVITLGRRGGRDGVLVDDAELERRGIALHRATRGGEVTYHGPGQLVMYPVIKLRRGIVEHVMAMADAIVETARDAGVVAEFRRDCPGVWVGKAKLAAFGVHVHRRVAIHGAAFNVSTALDAFSLIVPCGVPNCPVTSVEREGGRVLDHAALVEKMARALCERLEREPVCA